MREIKSFSCSQVRLDSRPYRHYCCIRQQAHNDRTFFASFFNTEQSFTRNPSVSNRFVICLSLALTNDYIETVITQVQCLSRTLYAITDYSDCFIFQYFTSFFQWKFITDNYIFYSSAKIQLCHFFCFFVLMTCAICY